MMYRPYMGDQKVSATLAADTIHTSVCIISPSVLSELYSLSYFIFFFVFQADIIRRPFTSLLALGRCRSYRRGG